MAFFRLDHTRFVLTLKGEAYLLYLLTLNLFITKTENLGKILHISCIVLFFFFSILCYGLAFPLFGDFQANTTKKRCQVDDNDLCNFVSYL